MKKKIYIKESGLLDFITDTLGDAIPQLAATVDGPDLLVTIPALAKNIFELKRNNKKFDEYILSKPEFDEESIKELSEYEDTFKRDLIDVVQRVIESLPGSGIGSITSFSVGFLEDLILEKFIEKMIDFKTNHLSNMPSIPLLNDTISESLNHLETINKLQEDFEESSKELSEVTILNPVKSTKVTGKFKELRGGGTRKHWGVDLALPSGSNIISPLDGVMIKDTGYHNNNCGGTMKIQHGGKITTRYCHVKKINFLKLGTPVKRGQVIGLSGGGKNDPHRGRSTGAHLHFEMKKNGKLVDPMKYINKDEGVEFTEEDWVNSGFDKDNFSSLVWSDNQTTDVKDATPEELAKFRKVMSTVFKGIANDLKESSNELQFHLSNNLLITENIFRHGSPKYFNLINESRELYNKGVGEWSEEEIELLESDCGKFFIYEGERLPFDFPMITESEYQGKDVDLNKPKSGGSKKWYVYVKNPKTGKVKKISYGSPDMSAKWNDPVARKSFAARHRCAEKKDKTKAGYWACRAHKDFGKNVSGRFW